MARRRTARRVYSVFSRDRDIVFQNQDCLSLLTEMPNSFIDLTLTSPPYCIGKSYESERDAAAFRAVQNKVLPEIVRLTRDGGAICIQVGYHVSDAGLTPLDFLVHEVMSRISDVKLVNRIIWTYGHGLHCKTRFSGRHEVMLWYSKGEPSVFNLDAVRIKQRYPGKTHYKGKKKGHPSGNPLGKNPSDVWDIPNVKARHVEKTVHPCQFPIGLAQRVILALTKKDGRVLDPFAGVATSACAAVITGRKFYGSEINKNFHRIGVNRIKSALRGTLRFREHNLPVVEPDPNSKVARDPFIKT